jgi:hypothetical protein
VSSPTRSQQRGITSNSVRTTRSKPITAGSNTVSDRCADCVPTRTAQTVIAGHAFVQNLRRGHYEIATETPPRLRLAAAFTGLATAI